MKYDLNKINGSLLGGAIGDAIGSFYENTTPKEVNFDVPWHTTDDTQFTIATAESIVECSEVLPDKVAAKYLEWFNANKITGIGASTLKAMRDLQVGAHWALSGRVGEYAAGNGAAMRIAPLAFVLSTDDDRMLIRDICNITHKNDEAYAAALAVVTAIQVAMVNVSDDFLDTVIGNLPDTAVRDNIILLKGQQDISIQEAAKLIGCSGHAVQSIPLALFAASKIKSLSFDEVLVQLIKCGGDTDTNCSISGQITGAFIGFDRLPVSLLQRAKELPEYMHILTLSSQLSLLS